MSVTKTNPPTYCAWPVEAVGRYAIGVEKLPVILADIKRLTDEHWAETEILYRQLLGKPNFPAYIALEADGKFVTFTARDLTTGEMVGYLMYYIYENMHSMGVMEAREDAFFINKLHRGSKLANAAVSYAEKCFRSINVDQITMSSKAPAGGPDLDKFYKRKGYKPVAIAYYKSLIASEEGI